MKNFLKLLNFELNRFMKLYIVLLVTIFVIQITGTIIMVNRYMVMVNNSIIKGGMSQQVFLDTHATFSMADVVYTAWIFGPIAIGGAALLFYLFFIWYRDWFAKNTFIYRLLMLPTARMNIFFSKVVAIMLTVLGLVAFQVLLFMIESNIVKWIVPKVYRSDLGVAGIVSGMYELSVILPRGFGEFIGIYALGFAFVIVLFTAILFERSFKVKGIVLGALYVILSFGLFILPLIAQIFIFGDLYLYEDEMFLIGIFIWLVVVGSSLWISRYLLNNKVTV